MYIKKKGKRKRKNGKETLNAPIKGIGISACKKWTPGRKMVMGEELAFYIPYSGNLWSEFILGKAQRKPTVGK